jgi:hypothetical protein
LRSALREEKSGGPDCGGEPPYQAQTGRDRADEIAAPITKASGRPREPEEAEDLLADNCKRQRDALRPSDGVFLESV